MKKLVTSCQGKIYAENSTSTVWDTALVSYASQRAGRKRQDPMIMNSFTYLLDRQQMKKADWAVHNRHAAPGGFGFSHINTNNPDCDDTQIVLKAIPKNTLHFSGNEDMTGFSPCKTVMAAFLLSKKSRSLSASSPSA